MGYRPARMGISRKLKTKRKARIGIAVLVAGMLTLIIEAQYEPVSATVVRVIDGDTLRVRAHGKEYTVRLAGVDTPETKHPTKAVEHFGAEASAYTQAALEGQQIELEQDRTGATRDRYGRLLRYVRLNGQGLQRPADPRGLRPCDPGLSLLAESAVYPARTGSAGGACGPAAESTAV